MEVDAKEDDGYYIEPVSRADIARRRVSMISPSSARNEDTQRSLLSESSNYSGADEMALRKSTASQQRESS